ncbi:hypothetical protein LTR62_004545 [Meristemomyces frigidus]|uniref:Uncharacterized protein n=1 Tax=Meristemomyces frigidus TaxID=1508187 RepID=A0AAN7YJW3_9PEZI|nr:hypothetical protein LTR62_004545 [Meristemomyces frigidus]
MAKVIQTNTFSGIFEPVVDTRRQDKYMMGGALGDTPSAWERRLPQSTSPDFISDIRQPAKPAPPTKTAPVAQAKPSWFKRTFLKIKRAFSGKQKKSAFRSPGDIKGIKFNTPSSPPPRPRRRSNATGFSVGCPFEIQQIQHLSQFGMVQDTIEQPNVLDLSNQVNIMTTSPSGKRLTIHEGQAAPTHSKPRDRKRTTIRYAHPVVSAMVPNLPTPTKSSFSSKKSSHSFANGDEKRFSGTTDNSDMRSALDFDGKLANPIDPRKVFRKSSYLADNTGETYARFICDLDGLPHALASKAGNVRSSSSASPYLAFRSLASRDESTDDEEVVQRNRSAALAALAGDAGVDESNINAPTDLPSAARWRTAPPQTLLPGQKLPPHPAPSVRKRPAAQRKHMSTGGLYLAYTGMFNPYNSQEELVFPPTAPRPASFSGSSNYSSRPSTPSTFADAKTHKQHYSRIESGMFDSPTTKNTSRSDRSETPDFPPSAHHGRHYARVESGVFDNHKTFSFAHPRAAPQPPQTMPLRPPAPAPASPDPTQSRAQLTQVRRKPVGASLVPAAQSTKHLSQLVRLEEEGEGETSTTTRTRGSMVVQPRRIRMNENGFPIVGRPRRV